MENVIDTIERMKDCAVCGCVTIERLKRFFDRTTIGFLKSSGIIFHAINDWIYVPLLLKDKYSELNKNYHYCLTNENLYSVCKVVYTDSLSNEKFNELLLQCCKPLNVARVWREGFLIDEEDSTGLIATVETVRTSIVKQHRVFNNLVFIIKTWKRCEVNGVQPSLLTNILLRKLHQISGNGELYFCEKGCDYSLSKVVKYKRKLLKNAFSKTKDIFTSGSSNETIFNIQKLSRIEKILLITGVC